jgi:hypothetical protein
LQRLPARLYRDLRRVELLERDANLVAHRDGYRQRDSNQDLDCHRNPHSHSHADNYGNCRDINGDLDPNSIDNEHSNGDRYVNYNLYSDLNRYRERDQHSYADSYINSDVHGESYSDGDCHYHRHADLDCDANRNTYDDT